MRDVDGGVLFKQNKAHFRVDIPSLKIVEERFKTRNTSDSMPLDLQLVSSNKEFHG